MRPLFSLFIEGKPSGGVAGRQITSNREGEEYFVSCVGGQKSLPRGHLSTLGRCSKTGRCALHYALTRCLVPCPVQQVGGTRIACRSTTR